MTDLTIHLLGQFQVSLNGKAITHFATDKVRALLAYLAIENQYPHRREKLAALFWPEKSESTARANLRRALADLRSVIEDQVADPTHLLVTRTDIQFNVDSDGEIDCVLLDQYAKNGCYNPQDAKKCDQLLELYQGDFLEGFSLTGCTEFDLWQSTVREQYNRKMTQLLGEVIQYHSANQYYESALPFCRRLVSLIPWKEEPRRQFIQILSFAGYREEAKKQYQQLELLLKQDLAVEPEPETTQIFGDIISEDCMKDAGESLIDYPLVLLSGPKTPKPIEQQFFGRKKELERLDYFLSFAVNKNIGFFQLIPGEAGAGKTRLVRGFIHQSQKKYGNLIATIGYCNAYSGEGDPYHPFREILMQLCGDFESPLRSMIVNLEYTRRLWRYCAIAAKAVLNCGKGLIETIVPGYVFFNQISYGRYENQDWYKRITDIALEPQETTQSVKYAYLASQIVAVLKQISKENPLIIVIEDLQWADQYTIDLLIHLCKAKRGSNVFIVGTYRPEEVYLPQAEQPHPLIDAINEIQRDFTNVYTRLDETSQRQFLEDWKQRGGKNAFSPDFDDNIWAITGGNALLVRDLFYHFYDLGIIKRNKKGIWVETSEDTFRQIPARLEWIFSQHLQKLSPRELEYLKIACIEGGKISLDTISEITNDPIETIDHTLEDIYRRGNRLIEIHTSSGDGSNQNERYRFRHYLFKKCIYDRIPYPERKILWKKVERAKKILQK